MMPTCKLCGVALTSQEIAAYGISRCENCHAMPVNPYVSASSTQPTERCPTCQRRFPATLVKDCCPLCSPPSNGAMAAARRRMAVEWLEKSE
jgi:hypothetical protein